MILHQLSHQKFAEKNKHPFPLLCDEQNLLRKKLGVPNALGFLDGRVTYLFDSNGVVCHIFNDLVNSTKHVITALQIIEEID